MSLDIILSQLRKLARPCPYSPPDARTLNTSNKISLSWKPCYDHRAREQWALP